ncbi:Glucan endo-1,3-beta-glucosidase BGN13.1 [Cladobotryum mycophilum]|uniref:Glucan endo-1,3-beta-glucosidase BGN13.1 n=1 Tax=Cladobotryum mycophilum TaxID=491253 RepID=A0ABR0SLK6_9HYPO
MSAMLIRSTLPSFTTPKQHSGIMVKITAAIALLLGVASATPAPSVAPSDDGLTKRATSFWYANMDHTGTSRGYSPNLGNDFSYQVYKTVNPGDGAGIQAAINDDNGGQRHGQWLASQPRVVYIPPGTYEIHQTIKMNTDTILMGDATNPPIIKAAAGFSGDQTLITGQDPTTGVSGELSFAVGLKNLILDTTAIGGGQQFTALWWGVAQAAQLQNIKIAMAYSQNNNGHTGIRLGRGSTLALADVRVERGQNGIWHDGHQQAAYHNIYFYQNTVGMLISGGSTISIFSPTFDTCGTGVSNTGGAPWIAIVDGKSINSGTTFTTNQYPSFLIENLSKDTTNTPVAVVRGQTAIGGVTHVDTYTWGNTINHSPTYDPVTTSNQRPGALAPGGRYPAIPVPNYANTPASGFINVKDPNQNGGRQVLGDNTKDESGVLNDILKLAASSGKIAYFPFGVYRVDSTLYIPPDRALLPVVSVGRAGEVGVAQIQDMRFTVSDVLPGAIIIQFNMAGNNPGDVALWNSLITVGGTRGASALTNSCGNAGNQCKAAFTGIHLTKTSSALIQNVWNWVADHTTEDFSGGSNIAAKGGVLVESTKATWLYGLGSEHWWLYQLNLRNAVNVVVSMLQSETNYDQGSNTQQIPPAPWSANVNGWGDPDFSWCGGGDKICRMGFGNYINGGSNIYTYASASWAFFSGPGYQGCGQYQCQQTMHWIAQTPSNLQAFGICSKDAQNIIRLSDNTRIVTSNGFTGSWPGGGGAVGRYTP